jgi:hypothetical protein
MAKVKLHGKGFTMTKKDYTKIAQVFRARVDVVVGMGKPEDQDASNAAYLRGERAAIQGLIVEFVRMLKSDNEQFNSGTFYVACGLDGAGAYHR